MSPVQWCLVQVVTFWGTPAYMTLMFPAVLPASARWWVILVFKAEPLHDTVVHMNFFARLKLRHNLLFECPPSFLVHI
eukprot:4734945-Amphidinium_carterae.1